jgi:hypothetical protein
MLITAPTDGVLIPIPQYPVSWDEIYLTCRCFGVARVLFWRPAALGSVGAARSWWKDLGKEMILPCIWRGCRFGGRRGSDQVWLGSKEQGGQGGKGQNLSCPWAGKCDVMSPASTPYFRQRLLVVFISLLRGVG